MRARLLSGIAAGTLALVTLAAVPASAADPAKLSVLHGVPGLTVDVWVNGERTLDDFTPGSLAGPLDLPAGTYTVAITAADAADASAPAIGPVDLTLEAGKNYTAVAHLDAAGAPTATLFTNDISTTAAGQGRLTVRHVAAAPGVDILAGSTRRDHQPDQPEREGAQPPRRDRLGQRDRHGHHDARTARPGRRAGRRGHQHDRLRVGQRDRVARHAGARHADHHRPAQQPVRRERR